MWSPSNLEENGGTIASVVEGQNDATPATADRKTGRMQLTPLQGGEERDPDEDAYFAKRLERLSRSLNRSLRTAGGGSLFITDEASPKEEDEDFLFGSSDEEEQEEEHRADKQPGKEHIEGASPSGEHGPSREETMVHKAVSGINQLFMEYHRRNKGKKVRILNDDREEEELDFSEVINNPHKNLSKISLHWARLRSESMQAIASGEFEQLMREQDEEAQRVRNANFLKEEAEKIESEKIEAAARQKRERKQEAARLAKERAQAACLDEAKTQKKAGRLQQAQRRRGTGSVASREEESEVSQMAKFREERKTQESIHKLKQAEQAQHVAMQAETEARAAEAEERALEEQMRSAREDELVELHAARRRAAEASMMKMEAMNKARSEARKVWMTLNEEEERMADADRWRLEQDRLARLAAEQHGAWSGHEAMSEDERSRRGFHFMASHGLKGRQTEAGEGSLEGDKDEDRDSLWKVAGTQIEHEYMRDLGGRGTEARLSRSSTFVTGAVEQAAFVSGLGAAQEQATAESSGSWNASAARHVDRFELDAIDRPPEEEDARLGGRWNTSFDRDNERFKLDPMELPPDKPQSKLPASKHRMALQRAHVSPRGRDTSSQVLPVPESWRMPQLGPEWRPPGIHGTWDHFASDMSQFQGAHWNNGGGAWRSGGNMPSNHFEYMEGGEAGWAQLLRDGGEACALHSDPWRPVANSDRLGPLSGGMAPRESRSGGGGGGGGGAPGVQSSLPHGHNGWHGNGAGDGEAQTHQLLERLAAGSEDYGSSMQRRRQTIDNSSVLMSHRRCSEPGQNPSLEAVTGDIRSSSAEQSSPVGHGYGRRGTTPAELPPLKKEDSLGALRAERSLPAISTLSALKDKAESGGRFVSNKVFAARSVAAPEDDEGPPEFGFRRRTLDASSRRTTIGGSMKDAECAAKNGYLRRGAGKLAPIPSRSQTSLGTPRKVFHMPEAIPEPEEDPTMTVLTMQFAGVERSDDSDSVCGTLLTVLHLA
ncbi:hypothetical protein CYMTET_35244 [Cymbomonas tetramitiformis]|uniref:Uncharacterized protein n=1 Tax=Cymbomonas tetramitiformis TaxID=36881 RepID=A0AAE0KP60_9CHLO|nr:hypothetical protein CYMTET_35244 [Cymbomonas tetramitiformis]